MRARAVPGTVAGQCPPAARHQALQALGAAHLHRVQAHAGLDSRTHLCRGALPPPRSRTCPPLSCAGGRSASRPAGCPAWRRRSRCCWRAQAGCSCMSSASRQGRKAGEAAHPGQTLCPDRPGLRVASADTGLAWPLQHDAGWGAAPTGCPAPSISSRCPAADPARSLARQPAPQPGSPGRPASAGG